MCKIEVATGGTVEYGTGFLVGPDLVLTCHHLLEEIIDNGASPTGVRCGSGSRWSPDGTVQWPMRRLARDWLVATRTHGAREAAAAPSVRVRISSTTHWCGSRAGPGTAHAPGGRRPGVGSRLSSRARKPAPGTSLVVIQHPGGAPLSCR